ncbi:AAA family ATPase [Clostridium tyrobutyricum]|nr:AAA family ATPase [Clostridium tyrobutyricum]MBV4443015.1 AAA family ATPase [Clostridium tyrobutyricum]
MTQFSHSRVECFKNCQYKYKLRYIDKLKTIPDQAPDNALYVGTALHKGAEMNVKRAIREYFNNYYVINDLMANEAIKLEILIPKLKDIVTNIDIFTQEYKVLTSKFIGFLDLITKNEDGTVDIFDFKYSNNIQNYLESDQLHVYKYFLEKKGFKVRKLGFIFIPKTNIRQKQDEDLYKFRKRLIEIVRKSQIQIVEVKYDSNKVIGFFDNIINTYEVSEYKKNPTRLCDWCEYKNLCLKGEDYMLLPKNERREKKIDINPDMWIYAESYVGKSTFVDKFNDLLFLNTDGNTDNTTSPVIRIADEVKVEGRLTKRKFAWEIFLEAISELEKKQNDFKRVALDLVEDLYEHCRLYMYDKLGIEHEQDAGYGKGWDMVRTEFLSAIKRLKNLGYQIIYISKEITSEISLKNGSKLTTIKPNINDKVANVLAGTVDLTVRAYMDGENRYLQLEKKENIFGGGRFNFLVDKIALDKDEFIKALEDAQSKTTTQQEEKPKRQRKNKTPDVESDKVIDLPKKEESVTESDPKKSDEEPTDKIPEEKPKRRRRSRKTE